MSARSQLLADVLAAATTLDERMLKLTELARARRRVTPADVVWVRGALLAEVENEAPTSPA